MVTISALTVTTNRQRYRIAFISLVAAWITVAASAEILEYTGDPLRTDLLPALSSEGVAAKVGSDSLRVAFYNIEMFTDGIKDGQNRTEARAANQARGAAAIIKKLDADILLISEIENARILNILNGDLDHPYAAGFVTDFGTDSGRTEKMNIGLLSRYEPLSVTEIDFGPLRGPGRPTRGILRSVFDLGDHHRLAVYATHLKANYGERNRNYSQRRNAMDMIRDDAANIEASQPDITWEVVVVGDFNTDPVNAQFKKDPTLAGMEGYEDVWSRQPDVAKIVTVPTRHGDPYREFPPALFDRILVGSALADHPWVAGKPGVLPEGTETENVKVLPGEGKHVSDHYPVYLDLDR